jgi:hypothetical protein
MSSLHETSPQERLANSRRAIVRHMSRDSKSWDDSDNPGPDETEQLQSASSRSSGTWGVVKHAIQAWWHHHPVSVAFDLARPAIGHYAEDKPFKLLGIAAGIGAAAVLFRPWRLVSLGGVLLAALKSSELSGALHSVLSSSRQAAVDPDNNP